MAGDPLRALAALSVLVFHVGVSGVAVVAVAGTEYGAAADQIYTGVGWWLVRAAANGLFLFFVLSGYLISRPFVQAYVAGTAVPPIRPYLLNRAVRIIPAFWVVVTVVLLLEGTGGAEPLRVAAVYAFFQNLTPTSPPVVAGQLTPAWTLHVEVVFYLLVPTVAVLLARWAGPRLAPRQRLSLVLGLAAFTFVFTLALRELGPHTEQAGRWFASTGFAFMPGVVLGAIEPQAVRALAGARSVGRWAAAAAAVGAVTLLLVPVGVRGGPSAVQGALVSLGAGSFVLAPLLLQWAGRPSWKALDNRVLHWLGTRSYAIYLVHAVVISQVAAHLPGRPREVVAELLVVTVAASAALAALSWRYVEQPFLKRRRPWRRLDGRAIT